MIHLKLANRTRRENPRGENLRRRHSRVAIAIHRRSEKREEARSEKKREAGSEKREKREKREEREGEAEKRETGTREEDVLPIEWLRDCPDSVDLVDGSARSQIAV